MPKSRWDAIVFDQDGVLTPTRTLNHELELAVCDQVEIRIDPGEWKRFDGGRPYDTFRMIIESAGRRDLTPEDLLARKFVLFQERLRTMKLIPGAAAFLGVCRVSTPILALATSNTREVRQAVAGRFHLHRFFDLKIDGDSFGDCTDGKYSYTYILLGEEADDRGLEFELNNARVLVIDDGHYGVRQAKRLGWTAWGFAEDDEQEGLLHEAGADRVFRDFASMQRNFLAET